MPSATDHGPRVQGGLLMAHPGSVHGDGEAPEGESSLRQGAGTTPPSGPILETAAAAEKRSDKEKGLAPEGFRTGGKYRRKGAARGPPGSPSAPWA